MESYVIYDVVSDKVRKKIADTCLDYGMERIQFSAFRGDLTTNRRQELILKLRKRFGKSEGCIHILALCDKDAAHVEQIGKVLAERERSKTNTEPSEGE